MKLDLSGVGVASNEEIDASARVIFKVLRQFKSPKDSAVALALAHCAFLQAAFESKYKSEAFDALDSHSKIVKDMFIGGLN